MKKIISINIDESTETEEDMADVLYSIADLIRQGFTSGYSPDWQLFDEEKNYEEDAG